ncbi:MAG: DUF523 domain-containing protein [Candidatus Moranbacteria bacterium]|nr:DUF523 domain-containing protein [Candidatus Moranbacteria bacterium]NTW45967.1 DUF523 domain-containing protein [Candidatus Moranbacteria bacterium]
MRFHPYEDRQRMPRRNRMSRWDGTSKPCADIVELIRKGEAILKANSPSCGFGKTYDGTFSGTLTGRDGITGELFRKNGIRVITEEEL